MAQFKYSPKQLKFIRESIAKINIAHGSVRGGKTFATIIRFVELAIVCPDSAIVIIGSSFSSAKTNVVDLILTLYQGYSTWCDKHLILGDKKIRVIGAHDEASIRAITGNTISLAYVDELTTIPWNFVDMLRTRLTHPHSKMIATCNPNSPVHPVKEKLIDCGDPKYCYNLAFEVDDNPVLSEEYKNDLRTKYSGLFYKRYILGEWIAAEGAIYSDFSTASHVLPRGPHFFDNYFVGVDYGIHNAFAAVLIGQSNTYSPHFVVVKELFWDSKKTFRQKLNSELADDLAQFIEGYNVRGIYLDPSAESFEVELKRRHMRVIQAKNDVYPGISFVANLVANHELKVTKDCPEMIREMTMYVWDSKRALLGEEKPIKRDDHACFIKDTLVDGIPIQNIKVGDLVSTRSGKKKVTARHRRYAICYQYLIGSRWISCTKDHPFFTVNRGWVKANDLIQSDIVVTRKLSWDSKNSANQSSSYSRGRNTDDILRLQRDLSEPILNVGDDISIEIFGRFTTAPYQSDVIYITSTKTPLIMIYPISNAFHQSNMQKDIQRIINEAFRTHVGMVLINGINHAKDESGIKTMLGLSILDKMLFEKIGVTNAEYFIQPKNYLAQNFVRISVNQNGEEILELIMSLETAFYAAKNFRATITKKQSFALRNVPRQLIGKKRVYNLSVEDVEEYFAEDILVHNCDALRYCLFTAFGLKKNLKWGENNDDGRTLGGGRKF